MTSSKGARRRGNVADLGFYDAFRHDRSSYVLNRGFAQADSGTLTTCAVARARPKPVRLHPSQLADELATWKPLRINRGDEEIPCPTKLDDEEGNTAKGDNTESTEAGSKKRKWYATSHDPNSVWLQEAVPMLHELFRFDGLGDNLAHPCCYQCGVSYPADDQGRPVRLFRCTDCHVMLQCLECCLDRHSTSPLHVIEEWNGTYYEKATLSDIGLVYQVGHGGLVCKYPDEVIRKLVVLDINGIHRLSVRYCNCVTYQQPSHLQQLMRNGWYPASVTDPRSCATYRCLDSFRALNVAGNLNARDFVTVLERITNVLGVDKLPDCYPPFGRMARQWSFLHRCKRSGTGFTLKSIADIGLGSLAIRCWACPWLGRNLPSDWDKSRLSYLHMPILALDANFRLKNKIRAKEKKDPPFAPGAAYFVGMEPYKKFLAKYVSETDISTCVAFAALTEKDTKLTTGLKTSGVAGCACARHEIIRPNGMGDLQKGERYANMDYVFFSAIQGLGLPRIGLSYDIICQWKVNVRERMGRLPSTLHQPGDIRYTFGLPTWHAVVHQLSCKTSNSLTYQEGVGRTDGEGIERIWSLLNPAGYSTKEMGEGNRHDSLDDRIDYLNFKKNLGHGSTLARRLHAAKEERDKQVASFDFVDKSLDPVKRDKWLALIHGWKQDRSLASPYTLPDSKNGPTEEDVRKKLKDLEEQETKKGQTTIYGTSPLTFMTIGLELEDLQCSIRRDAAITRRTALQERKLRERRETFQEMVENFRDLQAIYMPGAVRAWEQEELPADTPAEDLKLWPPSALSPGERLTGCAPKIPDIERQLRVARCGDALTALRQHLHMKQYLIAFRNANVTGQRDSGKARGLIDDVGQQVDEAAEKYRRSRQALLDLEGPSAGEPSSELARFPQLLPSDIALDNDFDPDLLVVLKLGDIGSEARRRMYVSTGKRTISWIWTANGGPEQGADEDEYVRVEWSKALARKDRWCEEVEILEEEMKRVLRYLKWEANWWENQMPTISPDRVKQPAAAIEAGMRAYAARQAAWRRNIRESFKVRWA